MYIHRDGPRSETFDALVGPGTVPCERIAGNPLAQGIRDAAIRG